MLEENKQLIEKVTEKTDKYFSAVKISANYFTLFSLIFSVFSLVFLIKNNLILASLFLFLAALLDWLDGKIARLTKSVTKLGAYLDTIVDRYVEGLVLLGFLFLPLPKFIFSPSVWIFLALFGSLLTTYVKAARTEKGLSQESPKLLFAGRAERIILILLSMILGIINLSLTVYIITALAVISNLSAVQRIIYTLRKNL